MGSVMEIWVMALLLWLLVSSENGGEMIQVLSVLEARSAL